MRLTPSLPACLALSCVSLAAFAAEGPPPPSVSQPSGINLGGTSFFDGFAGPPGLTHQTYLKFSTSSSIRDNGGKDNISVIIAQVLDSFPAQRGIFDRILKWFS